MLTVILFNLYSLILSSVPNVSLHLQPNYRDLPNNIVDYDPLLFFSLLPRCLCLRVNPMTDQESNHVSSFYSLTRTKKATDDNLYELRLW